MCAHDNTISPPNLTYKAPCAEKTAAADVQPRDQLYEERDDEATLQDPHYSSIAELL